MAVAVVISIGFAVLSIVLSMAFKMAGKLRLGLPLLYILIASISTLFTRWTSEHEQLVFLGLYILIGLVVLSWIVTIAKKIRARVPKDNIDPEQFAFWQIEKARKNGINLHTIRFDKDGFLLHPDTGIALVDMKDE